ncbi:MAG: aminopeptidase P family protein, partial [Zetaproteobacteria bacterium]
GGGGIRARLIYADTERDPDALYALGAFVPDPIALVDAGGGWVAFASDLELARLAKQAKCRVIAERDWRAKAESFGFPKSEPLAPAAAWLKAQKVQEVEVPESFPLAQAEKLRAWGFAVQAKAGAFFPERRCKSAKEIAEIRAAARICVRAMRHVRARLAEAEIDARGRLRFEGKLWRAEDLRFEIEALCLRDGAHAMHTIVACGARAADPHDEGGGVLRAHAPIVVDIFPRLARSGYWGDMTRTFCVGDPPPELVRMHRAVRAAQVMALGMVRAGADGAAIHRAVADYFAQQGFPTEVRRGKPQGFIHGTGHGVGLEIHEAPRISARGDVLRAGDVVTVEPGLYYAGKGGVRIEDLVWVREDGCEVLTKFSKNLIVRPRRGS